MKSFRPSKCTAPSRSCGARVTTHCPHNIPIWFSVVLFTATDEASSRRIHGTWAGACFRSRNCIFKVSLLILKWWTSLLSLDSIATKGVSLLVRHLRVPLPAASWENHHPRYAESPWIMLRDGILVCVIPSESLAAVTLISRFARGCARTGLRYTSL
jgi:hypothetical protein